MAQKLMFCEKTVTYDSKLKHDSKEPDPVQKFSGHLNPFVLLVFPFRVFTGVICDKTHV